MGRLSGDYYIWTNHVAIQSAPILINACLNYVRFLETDIIFWLLLVCGCSCSCSSQLCLDGIR